MHTHGAFAINLAALAPALGGLGLTLAAREAGGCYSASAIFAFSSARSLHPAFAALDLTTNEAPSVAALRAAHSAILVAHRRVTAAYDAFDSAAPTVDRTGAESTSFRLAGLPELVLSAAHLPPTEDSGPTTRGVSQTVAKVNRYVCFTKLVKAAY